MTTTIKIQAHGFPCRIDTYDNGSQTATRILFPDEGETVIHCHVTREIRVVDLQPDDKSVLATRVTTDGKTEQPVTVPEKLEKPTKKARE